MPFIPPSDRRSGPFRVLALLAVLAGLAGGAGPGPVLAGESQDLASIRLPVGNFGFRGIAEDRRGVLYVSSSLRNGLYVLPAGCRAEACATLIPLAPSLGLPGQVVADPDRGGAYVLMRLGDRVTYVPAGCLLASCLGTVPLPERPSYPFRAVWDSRLRALAVLDRLSGRVLLIPEGCLRARCIRSIVLPSGGKPSGIAYDARRGNLWVTLSRRGALVSIPAGCRKGACVRLLPLSGPALAPSSPAISPREDRLYLVTGHGTGLGWLDLSAADPALSKAAIEETSGRLIRLFPLASGGLFVVTGGVHPHAGTFAAGPACPGGCFNLRLLPFENGAPYGLSPGRKGRLWMTIDDRDSLLFITRASCLGGRKAVLGAPCLREVPFHELETLYHSRYHQEITVPRDSSPAEPQD